MVETVEKLTEDCSSVKIQNIPVIFIEDRDDEVSERIMNGFDHYSPSVRIVNITKPSLDAVGGFGFLLSRSKWDPYPYVSKIDEGSPASSSGIKEGDCVLEVNGEDVLGMRIADVANLVKSKNDHVNLLLWNTNLDQQCESNLCCGPMPSQYEKLAATVQTILTAIECPVCLNSLPSPFTQCQNGHLLCIKCRARSEKCPICRANYSVVRCLLAEQIYTVLIETFNLQDGPQGKIRERIFGAKTCKSQPLAMATVTPKANSHTQKFLAKIMGKSSSLETLNQQKELKKVDGEVRSGMLRNKVHSQSASNICRAESTPMSIAPITQKLGSDLSNSCGSLLGSRRHPRSCNASSESLPIFPSHANADESLYLCPAGEECSHEKLKGERLVNHVNSVHRLPTIFFGCSRAEISLPPRMPVEKASLIFELDGKQFWVKVNIVGNNDLFISCLMQASFDYTSKYILEIAIRKVANKVLGVQLINRNEIYSLQSTSWQEIFTSQRGIKLTSENIRATFANDEINLQVSIKRIEDM